jgi:hypothetical protein
LKRETVALATISGEGPLKPVLPPFVTDAVSLKLRRLNGIHVRVVAEPKSNQPIMGYSVTVVQWFGCFIPSIDWLADGFAGDFRLTATSG